MANLSSGLLAAAVLVVLAVFVQSGGWLIKEIIIDYEGKCEKFNLRLEWPLSSLILLANWSFIFRISYFIKFVFSLPSLFVLPTK